MIGGDEVGPFWVWGCVPHSSSESGWSQMSVFPADGHFSQRSAPSIITGGDKICSGNKVHLLL